MLWMLTSIALADCPVAADRTALELATSLEDAESSYGKADVNGFLEAADAMDAVLPCMAESVPRSLVARLHRTTGMRAFVGRNNDGARAAFAGSRALEPTWSFPPEMVPQQHPMAKLFAETTADGVTEPTERPAQGHFLFDGRRSLERPTSRVTLLQHVDGDAVLGTWYLWPTDPMPGYERYVEETVSRKKKGLGPSTGLLIGAGAAALLAGGATAAAATQRGAYFDAPAQHKDALRTRTHTLVVAGAGIGVAAVGLGATAVVVGKW